jgi:hypothetical protein
MPTCATYRGYEIEKGGIEPFGGRFPLARSSVVRLFFRVNGKLWATDGTAPGTVELGDATDTGASIDIGRRSVIATPDGVGTSLIITDGTARGTERLAELPPLSTGMVVLGNRVIIAGVDVADGSGSVLALSLSPQ